MLRVDGTLALSTPHKDTDVDELFTRIKAALVKQGIFESLENAFHNARECHAEISSQIHRFTVNQLDSISTDSEFQVDSMFSAYGNSVRVVGQQKNTM